MSGKLKERVISYQEQCDYKLLNRLPIVICLNGRSFSKVTSLLDKPYCSKFAECILNTMLRLCTDVEGVVFAYQHHDEIVLLLRNDQNIETTPWFDNKLQKICSITSSIASVHFNKCASAIELNLVGEPFFISQVFTVPTMGEAINLMIYKQQQNFHTSIQSACFYNLINKYDKNTIREMTNQISIDEKIALLQQECNVDFNDCPTVFKRGAACYKVPKVNNDGVMKNKWFINTDLPIFTQDTSFISNVVRMGADIFRKDDL